MKKTYIRLVISILLLLSLVGCASKTKNILADNVNFNENGLVIGSLSRNSGKVYFVESGFMFFKNKKLVKSVIHRGEDVSLTNLRNPFKFNDDFKYETEQGSIFSVSLPEGTYLVSKFYTGSGGNDYNGNYQFYINVKKGDIIYIGDFKFEPFATRNDNLLKNDIPVGAKLTVQDNLDRDYNLFSQKLHLSIRKDKIKKEVKQGIYNLNSFSSSGMIFVPVFIK